MSLPASRSVYKMASSVPVFKSIHKELLNCAVCQSRYASPKLLPCFHSFCEPCLLNQTPPNSLSITCPVCRHPSILPKEGVAALPGNVFITSLMDIIDFSNICDGCREVIKTLHLFSALISCKVHCPQRLLTRKLHDGRSLLGGRPVH